MNLEHSIVREIENGGPLSFARFMELALYAPDFGYYEQKGVVGKSGDFYTSVSVGCLFGEMLAFQFSEWLSNLQGAESFQILEAGANDGQLTADILRGLQQFSPDLAKRVAGCILEPSGIRQQWQREKLREFSNVRWCRDWDEIAPFTGIIVSNELLDAMPFHRLSWNRASRTWNELKVDWNGKAFTWVARPAAIPGLPEVADELAEVLPDGFETEVSPVATSWWQTAAGKIKRGKLITFDYGLLAEEFFTPERSRGTARAYREHRFVEDLLSNVGKQDLTCHINFSELIAAGEAAGFNTEFLGPQSRFLSRILERQLKENTASWDQAKVRQFQTLTHPTHLGSRFKVLVQGR